MSDCRWSKRCLGLTTALAVVYRNNSPAARLESVRMMRQHGTVCKRHGRELLEMPGEPEQTELKGI